MRDLPQRGPACRPGPRFLPGVLTALLALCVATAGCQGRTGDRRESSFDHSATASASPQGAPRAATSEELAYPDAIALEEGRLPALTMRTFELPAGSNVTDWTERMAAYAVNQPDQWHPLFGLLDLSTGKSRVVLREAVNEDRGFIVLSPRISDSWMAWEELTPNEDADPDKAEWFLYAAPLDPGSLSIGDAVMIDHAVTNYQLRPHYVVIGSRVFWTANMWPGPGQEPFPRSASLRVLDLRTGERRVLITSQSSLPTLCGTDGLLSLTEECGKALDGSPKVRALLVDPVSGKTTLSQWLGNTFNVSHFITASKDWLAWATVTQSGAEWPDLFFAHRSEYSSVPATRAVAIATTPATGVGSLQVLKAGIRSIDPTFFDRYMAFESVERRVADSSSFATVIRRIWVADLERRSRSILLETVDGQGTGWWQTCAGAQRTRELLVWNDLGPWMQDQSQAKTLVRIYRPE